MQQPPGGPQAPPNGQYHPPPAAGTNPYATAPPQAAPASYGAPYSSPPPSSNPYAQPGGAVGNPYPSYGAGDASNPYSGAPPQAGVGFDAGGGTNPYAGGPAAPSGYGGYAGPPYSGIHAGTGGDYPGIAPEAGRFGASGPPSGAAGAGPAGFDFPSNPLAAASMMANAGSYLSQGQQWAQGKMSWFHSAQLSYQFNVDTKYVRSKLSMLMLPYLKRWDYLRVLDQIAGGQKYRAPRHDVNAPDLYIPLMAVCTYCLLCGLGARVDGRFAPNVMYACAYKALLAWAVHTVVWKVVLSMMALPGSVPWLEVISYSGYAFVPMCLACFVHIIAGNWAFRGLWLYGALCMAVFYVRSVKRIIINEMRSYSQDASQKNYLLLALALFQFPLAFWLGLST